LALKGGGAVLFLPPHPSLLLRGAPQSWGALNVRDSFRNATTASPRQRTVFVSERIQLNEAAPPHCRYDRALWALYRQVSRVNKENNGGHSRVGMGLWLFCGMMVAWVLCSDDFSSLFTWKHPGRAMHWPGSGRVFARDGDLWDVEESRCSLSTLTLAHNM